MAKNYRDANYFENRPDIVKIFDDLEDFLIIFTVTIYLYNLKLNEYLKK